MDDDLWKFFVAIVVLTAIAETGAWLMARSVLRAISRTGGQERGDGE